MVNIQIFIHTRRIQRIGLLSWFPFLILKFQKRWKLLIPEYLIKNLKLLMKDPKQFLLHDGFSYEFKLD